MVLVAPPASGAAFFIGVAVNLRTSAEWLAKVNETTNGTSVLYSRGDTTEPVLAVLGRNTPTVDELADGRVQVDAEPLDFHIRPVRLAATFGDPLRGDRVTLADGRVYEVGERAGLPCFEPIDHYRACLRVRTIRQRV